MSRFWFYFAYKGNMHFITSSPGHSSLLPRVRRSYRGFLVYVDYNMWLKPKTCLVFPQRCKPCLCQLKSLSHRLPQVLDLGRPGLPSSHIGPLNICNKARAACLRATCDHWTCDHMAKQQRRFILNNVKFKWKKNASFNDWKKPSYFQ